MIIIRGAHTEMGALKGIISEMMRKSTSLATALIMLALLFAVVPLVPQPARANPDPWWDTDWQYRMLINITESSGSTLTNYQTPITIDTATFNYSKADASGDDIRFATDGTECDYWIETWNTSGESKLWVEMPSIPASTTTTIYMYYGNAGASAASNGTDTFIFFDDFEVDLSKWTLRNPEYGNITRVETPDAAHGNWSVEIVDSDVVKSVGIRADFSPQSNLCAAEFYLRAAQTDEQFRFSLRDTENTRGPHMRFKHTGTDIDYKANGVWIYTAEYNANQWYDFKLTDINISASINGTYDIYIDGSLKQDDAGFDFTVGNISRIDFRGTRSGTPTFYVDLVKVRKYADPEPTVNPGQEESSTSWMDYFGGTAAISASTNITVSNGDVVLVCGIAFDAVSNNAGGGSNTLSWSHTIGSGSNRILIVTSAAEGDSPTEHVITGVTYSGQSFTKAVSHVVGSGTYIASSEIWYLLEDDLPSAGTYTVEISFTDITRGYSAGAISLFNVKQSAPEATNSSDDGESGAGSITTSITTLTDGAWAIDVVASGRAISFTPNSGNTERWDQTGTSMGGAGSTKAVATAGSTNMGWNCDGVSNRLSHVVAAFAPVTSGELKSTAITPEILGSWGNFTVSHNLPAGTNISYKILKASDDSVLCNITAAQAAAGYNISSCTGTTSSIKLYAELSTTGSNTSTLHDWNVTWSTNCPPTVDDVELYSDSAMSTVANEMTPQTEYYLKVTVNDANGVDDIAEVKAKIYYDSAGSNPNETGFTTGNNQTCAILTWNTTGWFIDAGADTSWGLITGNCSKPSTGNGGDWKFAFKPGKVATESTDWDLHGRGTDNATLTAGMYCYNKTMNWYGEITVNTTSVDWGIVSPGCSNNISPVVNITYICNGNYAEQIKTSQNWTSASGNLTLNTTGSPGAGEFSLKADDDATIEGAVQVLSASYTTFDTGTQTTEAGNVENNNHLWLSLGSGIPVDTYSGTLYFCIACTHHAVSANDSAGGSFTVVDTTPPANVTDLAVSAATTNSLTLTWTAPGDDGNNGTAAEYDIRYATSNIDNETWGFATQVSGEPAPEPAGSNETFVVGGLASATTYYFALKTGDDAGNWANLSNIAHRATLRSGGGGGGGGHPIKHFTVDFQGEVTSVPMNWDGSLAVPLLATSLDGTASLKIDKGTKVLDAAGKPVDELTIRTVTNQSLSLPPNTVVVGVIHSLTPYNATFDKPATLTLGFSSFEVPEGALSLTIVYGSEASWSEIEVERTSIGELDALSARINHTGMFAIFAKMVSFSELEIRYMGQKVTLGNITTDGFLVQPLEFTIQHGNGELYFSLPEGTRMLNREGKPPAMIMIDPVTPSELPPSPSNDSAILMPFSIHPDLTIDPLMKVTIHYDERELGDGINEEDLVLAYYDEAREKWVTLPTEVDVEANTVTAWTSHTSIFAVLSNIAGESGEFPWWWIVGGVLGIALLAFLIRHRIRSRSATKPDASQTRLTK